MDMLHTGIPYKILKNAENIMILLLTVTKWRVNPINILYSRWLKQDLSCSNFVTPNLGEDLHHLKLKRGWCLHDLTNRVGSWNHKRSRKTQPIQKEMDWEPSVTGLKLFFWGRLKMMVMGFEPPKCFRWNKGLNDVGLGTVHTPISQATCQLVYNLPVVPGQAGGGSFKEKKL